MWGPLKADRVPQTQFLKWKRKNPKLIVCDFEIRVISKWISKSYIEFLKSFRNGPSILPSCL